MHKEQIGIVAEGGRCGETDFKACESNLIGISGCLVILVEGGLAVVSVGFRRRVLRRGMMAVLFYDDSFWVERSSRAFRCRYVALSEDNVQDAIYRLTSPYFWDSLSENPTFMPPPHLWRQLEAWYAQMQMICGDVPREYADAMMRNNILNLFMAMDGEMSRLRKVDRTGAVSRNRTLIIRFLKLLAKHFRHQREVSFYAQQLCITTTYLYKLTHKRWNLSPKEIINQQTVCEIKALLSTTDMSVKEIAHALNFEDPPYMCRYFRQHTGLSPIEFRNGMQGRGRGE